MCQRIGAISNLLVDLTSYNIDFYKNSDIICGTFGRVYHASIPLHHDDKQFDCAIKVADADRIHSTSELKMFLFEIETQSSLKHPAILPIIGYSLPMFDQKEYSIISPYMSNGTVFDKFVRTGSPLSFDTKKALVIFGTAAGMAFAHQNNIIHRDLKPGNILLDSDYHPKITDFSFAKYFVEGTEDFVNSETMVGTPIYMAPEMFNDSISRTSNKVDVYSFAITLYEILSGQCAYSEEKSLTPFKIYRMVEQGVRPTINEKLISPIFSELLCRCWSGDPANRPSFIEIVKVFMNKRDEFFNQPGVDKNQLNAYITEATKDLKL